MDGRRGLLALCAVLAANCAWPDRAGCAEAPAAGAKQTGTVTVIPGNAASDHPIIDFHGASALPLPSADPPVSAGGAHKGDAHEKPGGSSTGSHGSGALHPEILPK
jgi:hypothetical protein